MFRPAFGDAHKWFPRTKDRIEVRSHALKLRYWPEKYPRSDSGRVIDLDWSWIKACRGLDIGELRVDDQIGGQANIRIIFFRGDPTVKKPLPIIWVLAVFPKKRDDFTREQLEIFKGRRRLVVERFYQQHELG